MASLEEEVTTEDRKFERNLTALDPLTLRQKDFLRMCRRARKGDTWAVIGSWMDPPMSEGGCRTMLYRLKEKYKRAKSFTNLYEASVKSLSKEIQESLGVKR